MTPELTLALQLVILAATGFLSVYAASCARRAASFDVTRDFDALAAAVGKMQGLLRSAQMQRVRAAALEPKQEALLAAQQAQQGPLTHDQLRALARAKLGNGAIQ